MKSFFKTGYIKKGINYFLILIGIPLTAVICHDHPPRAECIYDKVTPLVWESIYTENLNNGDQTVIVSSDNSIPKAAYGIRLNFKIQPYNYPLSYDSCLHLIAADTIVQIKIYTLYDFDATHPANSDISAYFKVGETEKQNASNGYSYTHFTPIQAYLTTHADQTWFDQIDFLLMTEPQLNSSHEFKVELVKNNSSVFIPVHQVSLF
jgi:hypothetical protein